MAPNLGLLQAIGDPFNPEPVEREDAKFEFQKDPAIKVLLENPFIDPQLKKSLAEQELRRRRQAKIQFEIQAIKNRQRAEEEGQNGIVSFLGPVPIGFQFGTAAGIENPILRFATDVIADPINLVSGVGALTKLGRASKFLKGVSAGEKAEAILTGAKLMAKTNLDEGLRESLEAAIRANDSKAIGKAFNKVRKAKVSKSEIAKLEKFGVDKEFLNILKGDKKDLRNLKSFFELKDKQAIEPLKDSFISRVASGQQAFVNLGIPFSDVEVGSVRFPKLIKAIQGDAKPIKEALDTFKKGTGRDVVELSKSFVEPGIEARKANLDVTDSKQMADLFDSAAANVEKVFSGEFSIEKNFPTRARDIINVMKAAVKNRIVNPMNSSGIPLTRFTSDTLNAVEQSATQVRNTFQALFDFDKDALRTLIDVRERTMSEKQMEKFLSGLSDAKRAAFERANTMLDNIGEELKKFQVIGDLRENYLFHFLKPKNAEAATRLEKLNKVSTGKIFGDLTEGTEKAITSRRKLPRGKVGLRRVIDTFAEIRRLKKKGELKDIEIVTDDFAEILEGYIRVSGRSLVRNQMLSAMQAMNAATNGFPLVVRTGGKFPNAPTRKVTKRAREFVRKNIGSYEFLENTPGFDQFAFHKDIVRNVDSMFGRDFVTKARTVKGLDNAVVRFLEGVNNVAKSALFAAGFSPGFHSASFVYSNAALLPPAKAAQTTFDTARHLIAKLHDDAEATKQLLKMMTNSVTPQEQLVKLAQQLKLNGEEAVRLGVNGQDIFDRMIRVLPFGRVESDTGFTTVQRMLDGLVDAAPGFLKDPITGLKHVNKFGDRALWTIMRNGHMAQSWNILRIQEIRRNPEILRDSQKLFALESEISRVVTGSFGGILEQLTLTPNFRRLSRFLLLAPDWTLANLMMARDFFFNLPGIRDSAIGKFFTQDVLMRDVRFRHAMGYQMRAAFYVALFGNIANRIFTGRWVWENPEDARDADSGIKRVELPWKSPDGRAQYADIAKQFTEPLELARDPLGSFRAKMGILPRISQTLVVGTDSFGRQVYGTEDGPYRAIIERIASATGQFVPIPAKQFIGAATRQRSALSAGLTTAFGVPVRTQSRRSFEDEQELKRLREEFRGGIDI